MNDKLTIKEAAKLLGISPDTIRYYEKMGLYTSEKDENNKYRYFGFDDIFSLSNIILLKDCGIPLKEIRSLIGNYSTEKYRETLLESTSNIEKQIKELKEKQSKIKKNLELLNLKDNEFKIKEYSNQNIKHVASIDFERIYKVRDFYEILNKLGKYNIITDEFIYKIKEYEVDAYVYTKDKSDDKLQRGKYLEYTIKINTIKDEDEAIEMVEQHIDKLYSYADNNNLYVEDTVYFTESVYTEMIVKDGLIGTFFVKIKE